MCFKRCLVKYLLYTILEPEQCTIDWFVGIKVWGPCRLDKWFYCLIPEIDNCGSCSFPKKKSYIWIAYCRFIFETKGNWNIFLSLAAPACSSCQDECRGVFLLMAVLLYLHDRPESKIRTKLFTRKTYQSCLTGRVCFKINACPTSCLRFHFEWNFFKFATPLNDKVFRFRELSEMYFNKFNNRTIPLGHDIIRTISRTFRCKSNCYVFKVKKW